MLPPGIAPNDAALGPSIVNPKSRLIQLPCPACAFYSNGDETHDVESENDLFWIQDSANNVVLNFSISNDDERLELNGEAIYPPRFHRNAYLQGQPMYVGQVSATASEVEVANGDARSAPLEVTSSGLNIESEHLVSEDGDTVIPIRFQIIGLDKQLMDLDEVLIDLLKTSTGELLILKVDTTRNPTGTPFPPPPGFTVPPSTGMTKECSMLPAPICRLKSVIESKIDRIRHGRLGALRPCPDREGLSTHLPTHIKPEIGLPAPPPHHHGRPHHMRPHGNHHGQHSKHAFARAAVAVLIPILAGITVGLTVSLLGLLIGRLVGWVWFKIINFARGVRRAHDRELQDAKNVEEGEILLCEDGFAAPPPMYEDAPPYEEIGNTSR